MILVLGSGFHLFDDKFHLFGLDAHATGSVRGRFEGEAAGVACYEALTNGVRVQDIDIKSLRKRMAEGGSVVL